MKTVSVLIPCFNEVGNVEPMSEAVVKEFKENLPDYDYELVFIDNFSTDGTRHKLEEICAKNKRSKRFLMLKILVSSILHFMAFARRQVIVQ